MDACIAVLSTHLGHVGPAHTYWYLTVAPALANAVSERVALYPREATSDDRSRPRRRGVLHRLPHIPARRQPAHHRVLPYCDTFRLLFTWIRERMGTRPSDLDFADVDAATVTGFLAMLKDERHNTDRARSQRLAAIHSLFRHAALGHPEHAALIAARVLAIRPGKPARKPVAWLAGNEADALLAAPDPET